MRVANSEFCTEKPTMREPIPKKRAANTATVMLDFSLDTRTHTHTRVIEAYTKNPINFEWDCFCVRCQFQN